MNIVITGVKSSGKSTVGSLVAQGLLRPFVDLDDVVLAIHREEGGDAASCGEIYRTRGEGEFRSLELAAVKAVAERGSIVLSTGGSTLLDRDIRSHLRGASLWIYLDAPAEILWRRIRKGPLPAFLDMVKDAEVAFAERYRLVRETLIPLSDMVIDVAEATPAQVTSTILSRLREDSTGKFVFPFRKSDTS